MLTEMTAGGLLQGDVDEMLKVRPNDPGSLILPPPPFFSVIQVSSPRFASFVYRLA